MTQAPAMPSPEADGAPARLSPSATIFVVSLLGLFLELALIRWVGSEIRVFAYCKNLVLVASFLGFGAGCLTWRRGADIVRGAILLLLLALVVRLPWQMLADYGPRRVTSVLAELSGLMIFHAFEPQMLQWGATTRIAFAVAWTTALFFLIALVMVPFGQATAAAMARVSDPLRAYSVNVAGSLVGILSFELLTSLWAPPLVWFAVVALACCGLAAGAARRQLMLGLTVALVLVLLPDDSAASRDIWSTYQKLTVQDSRIIVVNNTGYQIVNPGERSMLNRIHAPYSLRRPPGRVLIVGAGVGNDVAAALASGASSVTAVEIDAAIRQLGRELHPARPYADPRVHAVIDDARHFLKTTDQRFDLIVFSHLDSHTVLSSYTNVRLDNYIYTVQSFQEARAHLAPEGLIYVSYWQELPFIGDRLARNLEIAFGHPPVSLFGNLPEETGETWRNVCFVTAEASLMPAVAAATASWRDYSPLRTAPDVTPSTDEWPFLPLPRPSVPPLMLIISGVVLVLSTAVTLGARPRGERFDGRVFWMGAAFMLVEVHNVSRLALVFGTTWQVNAWVIGAILTIILLANAVARRLAGRGQGMAAIGLFLSLALSWALPLNALTARFPHAGGAVATLLMTLPVFFAGLIFADAFARSPSPAFALGWNTLGAVVGGMLENLSYLWGIPALVPIAAVLYVLALLARRPSPATVELGAEA